MRSLAAKVLLAFSIPLVAALVSGFLVNRAFVEVSARTAWVRHTERAIMMVQAMEAATLRAETSARGYVITGDDAFFRRFADARAEFARTAADLRAHVSDNASQVARVDGATALFRRWDEETATPLLAARRSQADADVALLARSRVSIMTNVRLFSMLAEAVEAEQSLLDVRMLASEEAFHNSRAAIVLGSSIASVTAMLAALWLARDLKSRLGTVAGAAERVAGGDLGARSNVRGADEVARMARAFDTMASTVETRERDRQRLHDLSDMLQACITSDEAHEVIGRFGPSIFAGLNGKLLVINSSRNSLTDTVTFGEGVKTSDVFEPDDCWAIRRGRPHLALNTSADVCCKHLSLPLPRAYLCHPLLAQGETVGVLHLAERDDDPKQRGATLAELVKRGIAESVSEQLGMTTGNLRLRERLRHQSIRDPLTELFNRRYFDETLSRELARATRIDRPLGVILVDVDHFKRFNDTHGHEAGDLVLRELSSLLRSEFRASDFACRYGGEEFVIVLLDSGLEDVARRAETLRLKIKSTRASLHGESLGSISASMGVSAFPIHGKAVETLVRAADAALYRAKQAGRDRVEVASVSPILE